MQRNQVLEDPGDFKQRSGPHAVGVLFEPVLPVTVGPILANRQKINDFLDLPVSNHAPHPDTPGVMARYHDLQAAGLDVQEVEPLDRSTDSPAPDLFNHTYTMVGVDDFITNVENQVSTAHFRHPEEGWVAGKNVVSTTFMVLHRQGESKVGARASGPVADL